MARSQIPATVWASGTAPIDPHTPWPLPLVETLTGTFSEPGDRVLLTALAPHEPVSDRVAERQSGHHSPHPTPPQNLDRAPTLHAAATAIRALKRTVDTLVLDTQPGSTITSARPFWADLITDRPTATPTPWATSPCRDEHAHTNAALDAPGLDAPGLDAPGRDTPGRDTPGLDPQRVDVPRLDAAVDTDLALISLPADAAGTVAFDHLVLLVADRLRCGGLLAIYTHSDITGGRLTDPTGPIVTAAQNADLLYLQHIVVLNTRIQRGRLRPNPSPAAIDEYTRVRHHATCRGLPAPALRVHADVLLFGQPRSHPTPTPETTPGVSLRSEPGR